MSLTPAAPSFIRDRQITGLGMPGAPLGPALRSTSTSSAVTSSRDRRPAASCPPRNRTPPRGRYCRSSLGLAAECLMTAPRGARLPCSTAIAPSGLIGLACGRITSWPGTSSAPATTSRNRTGDGFRIEVDQIAKLCHQISARRRHDENAPCNAHPTAFRSIRTGTSRPSLSKASRSMRYPVRLAIAVR